MTTEEEVLDLRQEKSLLQEQLAQRDELIAHMQHELVLLREQVQALQEQLNKDSHNSHMPPSSDRFHRQPKSLHKSSGKKAGGQIGHPGSTLMLSPTPDQVVVHVVNSCQHCQRDLHEVESLAVERRQVLDLPPKRVVVIEHQAEAKCCPRCQQVSSAPFPQDVCAPVQYGAAVGAVGVYLVQQQLLPYERACEVMEDLLGCLMSVGTLQSLVKRCAKELEPVEQQIKAALRLVEVLHQDETGLYVAGQRRWMHVSATEHLTRLSGASQAGPRGTGRYWHPGRLSRGECA